MVKGIDSKDEKFISLKQHLEPMLGEKLQCIETALLKMEDGSWDDWFDLPIRLFFRSEKVISVAWSYFDRLFISNDRSAPFDPADAEIVWKTERIKCFSSLQGQTLRSVSLGQGDMTVDGQAVEVWTRLLLEFDKGQMEIYNGLDENAFAFHEKLPSGRFEKIC